MSDALVIGGGPAGLMAAEALLAAGHSVTLVEAMPTAGRKFLMAGKSGLNLTKAEPLDSFLTHYADGRSMMAPMVSAFGPDQVCDWVKTLGQDIFTGSTARVFPTSMKASPLLRAWLARLATQGLDLRTRWRWTGWQNDNFTFETPDGPQALDARVCVLALGGASWHRLGSNGAWADWIGPVTAPFEGSNVGLKVNWSDHMAPVFGAPIKGCALRAGDVMSRGEFIVSRGGLEGGGIYDISAAVRAGADVTLDLFPDLTVDALRGKLSQPRGKRSFANHVRKTLRLEGARFAMLNEFGRPFPSDLAPLLKALPIRCDGLDDIGHAISTVGGIRRDALNEDLMLLTRPGVFCAGEMIDWDAPTGGYLLTGCFATGRWAGQGAARYLS